LFELHTNGTTNVSFGGDAMKRLVTVALYLAMLSVRALAQDATDSAKKEPDATKKEPDTTKKESTVNQLQEMKKALEAQQQQIEKLKQEAEERDKALQQMQKQVQDELNQDQAAKPEQPGFYQAALTPSPGLNQVAGTMNPATGMPTQPWAVIKVSDAVNFRFGAVLQPTYEALQDINGGGYSQNFYLRRARFSILGTLPAGVTVFFQTDDPRVGYAGANGQKNVSSGFLIQDAYAQWAFAGKAAALQAGLFLVPTMRQVLTSVSTFLSLDLPTWSMQEGTVEEQTGGRDYGVGFNGAVVDSHLSYRVGVFSGYRATTGPNQSAPLGPEAGSRNPPRFAGRIMYDFFETEYVYSYQGTFLGKQKVLAIAGFGDGQGNYKGYGGDIFWNWPIGVGSVTAEADYMKIRNDQTIYNVGGVPTTLPGQYTVFANAGVYFADIKLQPFFRYEVLKFEATANQPKNQTRFGGGFNYYVLGQNFKIVPYYERVEQNVKPVTATLKDFNRFVVEFQGSF
jgi:phosphate-selective porin O/P